MDWKSKRIRAVLEAALVEDRAGHDVTTGLTIDPRARATGTIVAKQPCVVAGLGAIPAFFEVFAKMQTAPTGRFEVISHPEIFDGVLARKGATLAVIRHNARCPALVRTRHSQPAAAHERHRNDDERIRQGGERHGGEGA